MDKDMIFAGYVKGVSLLASSSSSKQMGEGAPMIAPAMRSHCMRVAEGVKCKSSPSTIIYVVGGMCAMVFLLVIAVSLLFYSHFRYRQRLRALQQFNYQQSVLREASLTTLSSSECETSNPTTCEGVVVVLLAGEKHALSCAKPCPFSINASPPSPCETLNHENIKAKECN